MEFLALFVIVAAVVVVVIVVGLCCALLFSVVQYPGHWLALLVLIVLMVSCSAKAQTIEVSVITETAADRVSADAAIAQAAQIYRSQLGVDLVASFYDVSTVAGHTKADALLEALKVYRVEHPEHLASDVTVLFTRRELTQGYEGVATIGPACSASASAVVRLRDDGLDGEILAHEIAHTVGVPHDSTPGWLMSESIARTAAGTFSPDSVLTFKAAPLAACTTAKPLQQNAQQPASVGAPSGGGGSFDLLLLLPLFGLLIIIILQRRYIDQIDRLLQRREASIDKLQRVVDIHTVPTFVAADCAGTWISSDPRERTVLLKFRSLIAAAEFQRWMRREIDVAKDEAAAR